MKSFKKLFCCQNYAIFWEKLYMLWLSWHSQHMFGSWTRHLISLVSSKFQYPSVNGELLSIMALFCNVFVTYCLNVGVSSWQLLLWPIWSLLCIGHSHYLLQTRTYKENSTVRCHYYKCFQTNVFNYQVNDFKIPISCLNWHLTNRRVYHRVVYRTT